METHPSSLPPVTSVAGPEPPPSADVREASRRGMGISEAQASFFREHGYLVVKGCLSGAELAQVDVAMSALIAQSAREKSNDDFRFAKGVVTGDDVLCRIEYVVDKMDVMKALLGHPFILRSVETLQGPSFVPTWDSMVVKMPGEGVIVPWHRDDELEGAPANHPPVFNVDMYLDDAGLDNCVWVIPGSHRWSAEKARARVGVSGNPAARRERLPFSFEGAIPVPMQKGDVLFHDVLLVHGSPDGRGNALRRTVYYEFRPIALEAVMGPHNADYVRAKQLVLIDCIRRRKAAPYASDELPFQYRPESRFSVGPVEPPSGFRFVHGDYRFEPRA